MAMADYLGAHGAKHIVITSKRGIRDGGQQAYLLELFDRKINVSYFRAGPSTKAVLSDVIVELQVSCKI